MVSIALLADTWSDSGEDFAMAVTGGIALRQNGDCALAGPSVAP
jgi:hypothetical protein